MKRSLLIVALVLTAALAQAQFTTVSGTVTDPNGLPYAYGTIASYIVATSTPLFSSNSQPYFQPSQASGLDAGGKFTVTLADNTQLSPGSSTWTFVVCSGGGTVQPAFGKGPVCFTVTGVTISGSAQNIGATLRAAAPALTATFSTGGGGGTGTAFENCVPDQTGNSFSSVTALTNYFNGGWQFVPGATAYINCQVYIPAAKASATIVLDIAANDGTAGHTATFQTCDIVINAGTINVGALTCAAGQTFTTTSTAYNRTSLTFNVQSTLSSGSILIVKIATSPTGTQPTANMLVYPHIVL